jgi:hypothetical protein
MMEMVRIHQLCYFSSKKDFQIFPKAFSKLINHKSNTIVFHLVMRCSVLNIRLLSSLVVNICYSLGSMWVDIWLVDIHCNKIQHFVCFLCFRS